MKYLYRLISFFILSFLLNKSNSFHVFDEEELTKRLLTQNSIKRLTSDLFMVNYVNDYYFEDLLNIGCSNSSFITKYLYSRFGNLYNLERNRFNSSFGCSSFNVLNSQKENLFGRNFDFPYSLSFIIWTQPKNKYKSISFALGLFLGMNTTDQIVNSKLLLLPFFLVDGLNEHGLGISVLEAQSNHTNHQHDPNKLDLTTTLMMRGVLDNCKTTQEAIDFFNSYNNRDADSDIITTYHFFITDSSGNSAIIEYNYEEIIVIKNNDKNYSDYLYVTNFHISKDVGEGNNNGYDRFKKMEARLIWNGMKL